MADTATRIQTKATPAKRLDVVQGLRGIAVLYVIAFHADLPLPGGFAGVDIFFVISGFVITQLLLRQLSQSGRISFVSFYRRRLRRLLPACAAMVCAVLVASALIESPIQTQGATALTAAAASAWLGNVALLFQTRDYFALGAQPTLLHTWSLSVEEQFYVLFPAVLGLAWFAASRWRRGTGSPLKTLAFVIAAGSLASLAINLWLCFAAPAQIGRPITVAFYLPFSRAWEFGAGSLVALWLARQPAPSALLRLAAPLGFLLVVLSGFWLNENMVFPGVVALLPVAGTALLIAGTAAHPNAVGRLLAWSPLVVVGDLSYSLYLWHWPFIRFATTLFGTSAWVPPLAALACVPVAVASYHLLEQPIRSGRFFARRTWTMVVPCVVTPLVLAAILAFGSSKSWGIDRIRDVAAQVNPRALGWDTCMLPAPVSGRDLSACTFNAGANRSKVILMGDSNAGQYSDGLVRAAAATDTTLVVAVSPGCAFNLVELYWVDGREAGCLALAEDALTWVKAQGADTILVSSRNTESEDPEFGLIDPVTGERTADPDRKARIWQRGLERLYAQLRAEGLRVVQITSLPHFDKDGIWTPAWCSLPALAWEQAGCGEQMTLAEGNQAHARGLAAEDAAAKATGVERFDLRPRICPDGVCRTNQDDFWVYRDGNHISVGMSLRLGPLFEPILRGEPAPTRVG